MSCSNELATPEGRARLPRRPCIACASTRQGQVEVDLKDAGSLDSSLTTRAGAVGDRESLEEGALRRHLGTGVAATKP